MNTRKLIPLLAIVAASAAQADTMVWSWPDVTATWTGTVTRVSYDPDDGDGHILFAADGEPTWTPTQANVFRAGFDEIQWDALITLPLGSSWETIGGMCSYVTVGTTYTFTCQAN